jgi:Tol biopolymer transport system component
VRPEGFTPYRHVAGLGSPPTRAGPKETALASAQAGPYTRGMGSRGRSRQWRHVLPCLLIALSCLGGLPLTPRTWADPDTAVPPQSGQSGAILFQSDRDGHSAIYRLDLPDTRVRRVTPGSTWDDEGPVWSPDGTRIAFASNRPYHGITGFDIFVMNADGADVRRLTFDRSDEREPGWAADGRSVFFSGERDGRSEVYRVWLDTTKVERVTNSLLSRAVLPAASPDGRYLAYVTHGLSYQIQLLDLRNGETRQITTGHGACRPRWSRDGRRLAYVENGTPTSAVMVLMLATGATQRAFADATLWSYDPAWSPDGSHLVIVVSREHDRGADWDLAVIDLSASGRVTRLTRGPGNDRLPDWR